MTPDPATDRLLELVRQDDQAIIDFTAELVRIRSVHDPEQGGNESQAAEAVAAKMREFGWHPQLAEVAPGRPNVVAVLEGGAGPGPTLMFEGHTDVVTEGDAESWSFDPYAGDVVDGFLRGRGSADMKSGVAAMLYAAKAVQAAGPFPGRLVVAALVDEEGLMLGAKAFARTELARQVDAAVCCEPEAGEICPVSKGALRIGITFTGVMAHGAMPQQGLNPIAMLARAVSAIEGVQQELLDAHGRHPTLGVCSITPTVTIAGTAEQINVIPAQARLLLDIRTIPGVNHAALVQRLQEVARRSCDLVSEGSDRGPGGVHLEVIDDRPVVDTPVSHPMIRALAQAHRQVTGQDAVFGGVPGATDGTILTRDAGIPTVVYGPGDKWIAHQRDEVVAVAEVQRCAAIYALTAWQYLHEAP